VHCSALQCIAVHCSALQCIAVHCSALQCIAVHCSALQCIAVCCSASQCVAVHCSALQCAAVQASTWTCWLEESTWTSGNGPPQLDVRLSLLYVYWAQVGIQTSLLTTGWRRPIGCLKLQVMFRNRANNYRALLRKMIYKDKVSYGCPPPCYGLMDIHISSTGIFINVLLLWYVSIIIVCKQCIIIIVYYYCMHP